MPEPMPVPIPSAAPLPLTDLFRAVSAHTGEFTCTRLRKPFDTRVVTFRHLIQPPAALEPLDAQGVPAPASETAATTVAAQSPAALALPDVGQLRAFYATFGALLLYHDAESGEAARYIAPPPEWTAMHEGFTSWTEDLSESENADPLSTLPTLPTLPTWVANCLVIGEAPHTGNNIVMATDGDCAGQVFEFDHDSLRFTQKGNNIVAYVERLLDLDTETLTEIAAPMRLTDKIYGVQWSIAEMRDNRGNHVRVRL